MAEPFTSDPAEVASRWRALTADEQSVASVLLVDAETYLRARVATVADRVAAGTLSAALVKQVQVGMVLRVMKNPEGKRQESIDDYSWTRDQSLSAGALYATAEELQLLASPTSSAAAFTVTPYGVRDAV